MLITIPKMTVFLSIAGLLALSLAGEAQAKNCGGLNEKSCWHVDPGKWCDGNLKYKPTGVPGKGTCVKRESRPKSKPKPKKDCGGHNQKSCWNIDPKKWCDSGLEYAGTGKPGEGRCIKPGADYDAGCGGLNQTSCWNANPKRWCDDGLKYSGTGKPGEGRCITPDTDPTPDCGGKDQQSCWHANPNNWCDDGLEYAGTGKPGEGRCIVPGSDRTPDCGGRDQQSCWHANPNNWCDDGLQYFGTGKPGEGRCIVPGSDPTPDCGGRDQQSCWHANPNNWCDNGLQYFGTGKPGEGRCIVPGSDPTPDCGGRDQQSCWHANPTHWCDEGLEYFGTGKPGEGRCIVPGSDPTPDCGGEDQKSCWHANPKHWCDDGMSYSPGVLPNQGTCYRKYSKEEFRAAGERMYETIKTLGVDNPLFGLRTCLLRPENMEQLQDAMSDRSENGVNRILSICGVSPEALKAYGEKALGHTPRTLEIGLGGGVVAGIGVEGSITYAIPLQPRPDGRYFLTNALGGGAGVAGGVDVTVGLTGEQMPTEHWISEKGRSVNFSGKALAGGSVSIDFPEREITPHGFTIGAGVGAGAEVGTVFFTRDQYLYNY
ncbi:MAG: hypothetical protein WD005_03635 [Haliea sp.]